MKKLFMICAVIVLCSCTHDKGVPDYNSYPDDIGKLIFTKCATPGCHTDASKDAAAGLSLQGWDKLLEGGKGSAAVIPFRPDYSTLFSYVNTFDDLGTINVPTMPFNKGNLSREEVLLIKNWINAGAPSRDGVVKFSDNPNRKKIYVTNQGCDVVTVVDQETLLPMRYIDVGNSGGIESPHMIKVSPDGQYWYVVSISGNSLQKYRTSDDSFVGEALLGVENWNTLTISNDGQKAYAVDWSSSGDIAEVNLNTLTVTHNIGYNYPHGSCLNPAGDTLYITQQNSSNKLYKMPVSDLSAFTEINLFTSPPASFLNAHEVFFSPDGTKYFVTCQGTSELRVFQQGTDQLLAVIPVGSLPSEMSASASHNYLFVSCPEDIISFPGKRGAVWVIDMAANTVVKTIYTGHQPHGIAVDDVKDMVYVANRNATSDGPAPHHSGACGGRNGYITFIEMNTLTLLKSGAAVKKVEISVDPYSVAVRP
ncbi:MAG: YncE family protein [Bacteroidota bacterium]